MGNTKLLGDEEAASLQPRGSKEEAHGDQDQQVQETAAAPCVACSASRPLTLNLAHSGKAMTRATSNILL
eukprot:1136789-Pelagomonas_calceolata.AAC.3